eukprot:COSAG02_NODE_9427_length_2219_cov_7.830889_3_plen_99_part_00
MTPIATRVVVLVWLMFLPQAIYERPYVHYCRSQPRGYTTGESPGTTSPVRTIALGVWHRVCDGTDSSFGHFVFGHHNHSIELTRWRLLTKSTPVLNAR